MSYGKTGRTDYILYKEFFNEEHDFTENVVIRLPFDILVNVITEFCNNNYMVNIDGKDTDVWNLFCGTNFIDNLFEDSDFVNDVKAAYDNSKYMIADYYEWLDSEPWIEEEDTYCE